MPALVKSSNAGASAKAAQSNQLKAPAGKLNKVTPVTDAIGALNRDALSHDLKQPDQDGFVHVPNHGSTDFSGIDDEDFHVVAANFDKEPVAKYMPKIIGWLQKQPVGTELTLHQLKSKFEVPHSLGSQVFKGLVSLGLLAQETKNGTYKKI